MIVVLLLLLVLVVMDVVVGALIGGGLSSHGQWIVGSGGWLVVALSSFVHRFVLYFIEGVNAVIAFHCYATTIFTRCINIIR